MLQHKDNLEIQVQFLQVVVVEVEVHLLEEYN